MYILTVTHIVVVISLNQLSLYPFPRSLYHVSLTVKTHNIKCKKPHIVEHIVVFCEVKRRLSLSEGEVLSYIGYMWRKHVDDR